MENEALSRAQEARLARLAEEFFAGDEQPLPGVSARGAENRLAAMKTLQSIYAALPGAEPVIADGQAAQQRLYAALLQGFAPEECAMLQRAGDRFVENLHRILE